MAVMAITAQMQTLLNEYRILLVIPSSKFLILMFGGSSDFVLYGGASLMQHTSPPTRTNSLAARAGWRRRFRAHDSERRCSCAGQTALARDIRQSCNEPGPWPCGKSGAGGSQMVAEIKCGSGHFTLNRGIKGGFNKNVKIYSLVFLYCE